MRRRIITSTGKRGTFLGFSVEDYDDSGQTVVVIVELDNGMISVTSARGAQFIDTAYGNETSDMRRDARRVRR